MWVFNEEVQSEWTPGHSKDCMYVAVTLADWGD